ncbi:MAG: TonB-dependent receptor [Gammaproteobacteria bacterium]
MRLYCALASATACLVVLPLTAQDSADSRAKKGLEQIIVTARHREENLQSIPLAASVIDGDTLDRSHTVNTQQITQFVPSLYYNSANPRNTAYTLRGLGSNTLSISAANDGIEPGVGFYVDQVYHGRPATAAFDFTDIDRVEVLRGPQGTLFGKNTTAGAIHVLSRAPTFEFESNAEVSVGNYDFTQVKGTVSGPFGEKIAGRISVQDTQRDGLFFNVRTGERLNELNNYAVRGQLLLTPNDRLNIRFIADASDLDSACCTQTFLRVGQSLRSAARQYPALAAGLGYAPPSQNIYDRLSDIDAPLHVQTQDGGFSVLAEWDLGAVAVTSVSAWRYWDWDVANDRDYTGIPIQLVQRIPSRQDQYSQEVRINSKGTGRFNYVAGLYWFAQEISGTPISTYGPEAAYWLLNQANFTAPIPRNLLDGYSQTGSSDFNMNSYAAFGEVNYAFTDRLTGTLGLRYTNENKDGTYATKVSGGTDLTGLAPATAAELLRAKLSIFRPQSYTAANDDGNFSGRANIAFRFTKELFGYLSYAHGYKSGGLNMSGLALDAQNQPTLATAVIKDETNSTFEAGFKSTLGDGKATLNLAAYRTEVQDYQANVVSNLETAAIRSYPANIPEVRVQGLEADFTTLLSEGFTLRFSLAYADGKNKDYPAGPCPLEVQTATTVACNLTGVPLAGLSKWSEALSLDYRRHVGRGDMTIRLDTNARDGYNSDTSASKYTVIDGFAVTNLSVAYRFARGWQVEAFARNLFDEEYIAALTIQTGNSGLILGQAGDPRMVGVAFRWGTH